MWIRLSVFRRDDVRYAFKVGIGAVLYAMWSFVPATRRFYGHWRGEWGLLSYMLVCSMVGSHVLLLSIVLTFADNRRIEHHRAPAFLRNLPGRCLRYYRMDCSP